MISHDPEVLCQLLTSTHSHKQNITKQKLTQTNARVHLVQYRLTSFKDFVFKFSYDNKQQKSAVGKKRTMTLCEE